MKKLLAVLLTLAVGFTTLTACSSEKVDDTTVRVGSLAGPTSMGLVNLMKDSENEQTTGNYTFEMATQAPDIAAKLNSGDLDIALIPANLASVIYNNTNGAIKVIDINTLGVLYCVTADSSITSVSDLAGKTVITTGQGTTPEYSLRYLLNSYGVTDCNIEFKSEATEVAATLAEDPTQIAVLPQPFVTATCMQNPDLAIAFSLSNEWDNVSEDSRMITGVTVVRTEFYDEHPQAVEQFLEEHAASVQTANDDTAATAELVVEYGILQAVPAATIALPNCNLVCITGEEMKDALSGYLAALYEQDPASVGGAIPSDDFYLV